MVASKFYKAKIFNKIRVSQEWSRLTDSFLGLQKEACRSFKFLEVLRIFSGPKLRSKLSKNWKITCPT
jgi:hypothetical protein